MLLLLINGWGWPDSALTPFAEALARRFADGAVSVFNSAAAAAEPARTRSGGAAALRRAAEEAAERPVLVAWSMGALAALELAASAPSAIRAAVVIGAFAKFTAGPGYDCGVAPAPLRLLRLGLKRNPAAALSDFFGRCAAPERLPLRSAAAWAAEALEKTGPGRLRADLDRLAQADARERLSLVRVPTLVLHGRNDAIAPPAAGEYLAANISNAQFLAHPEAGHALPIMRPEWTAEQVQKFLQ